MRKRFFYGLTALLLGALSLHAQSIRNFDKAGHKMIRFSDAGNAVDAHDGEIAQFDGVYYLYGTSYDCGFQWGNKAAPFCGFKVYTSTDLQHWKDRGFLFDAQTAVWQTRCDGKTYGCFRPHVIYNQHTKKYVLWINVYDNVVGYRVFTSSTPAGPFTEVAEPTLAVNSTMPAAGLNNGDHDTYVDDDGTAYLAYTDWRSNGAIVIEKLSDDYLTGSGQFVRSVTSGATEAPGLFKRKGLYYLLYSDPNCGYCSGTGTAYRTAANPLGPWSAGKKISDNSCGGQPSFVSVIKLNKETVYLYGSDLWNDAAKNEALADYYWAPLSFNADGSIKPLQCAEHYRQSGMEEGFHPVGDISATLWRAQRFVAPKTKGALTAISIPVFKLNDPDQPLEVTIYKASKNGMPEGTPVYTDRIAAATIGWSPKAIAVRLPHLPSGGATYIVVLGTRAHGGTYGLAMQDTPRKTGMTSKDQGHTYQEAPQQMLLKTQVAAR